MRTNLNFLKNQALSMLMLGAVAVALPACKKKEGCTDPAATNYDPDADKDCCCEYATNTGGTIEVTANITTNTTWTSHNKYLLKGFIYIEDGATRTPDKLGFCGGCDLIMHPAEGAFVFVVGDIDLDGIRVQTDGSHFAGAECASEKAPVIGAFFHFDNHRTG